MAVFTGIAAAVGGVLSSIGITSTFVGTPTLFVIKPQRQKKKRVTK
ncbi:hypothetical protein [Phyllobacterium salinisoli]|nr:hypothetical protein [Phyllobacterium salinisoli]